MDLALNNFSGWYAIKPNQTKPNQEFLSNSYNLHTVVWFQDFLSDTNILHIHIHEYGHVRNRWNGHQIFITIEHRNPGIRKHVTTSCSGTKSFYQLWVKGFDTRRRDTIFYAVLFIWPPTRAAPIGRTFASRLRAPKVDPSRFASSTQLSFQIITQTSARFRCVTSPAPCHRVSSRTIMTSEWYLHPPVRASVNTCLNVAPN